MFTSAPGSTFLLGSADHTRTQHCHACAAGFSRRRANRPQRVAFLSDPPGCSTRRWDLTPGHLSSLHLDHSISRPPPSLNKLANGSLSRTRLMTTPAAHILMLLNPQPSRILLLQHTYNGVASMGSVLLQCTCSWGS